MLIRPVQETDLPSCLAVIHQSFATVAAEYGLTQENCPTNGAFMPLARLKHDFETGIPMYAMEADGGITGFMQIAPKGGGIWELEKLAVLPAHRHKGCGKALLCFAQSIAAQKGGHAIVLGIIEENTRLKNWYAANGFVHTGCAKFAHLPFTVGFMQIALSR